MSKRITLRALAAMTLTAGFGFSAWAVPPAPKAEEMNVAPKQAAAEVAVLSAADLAKCRVEAFPNAQSPVGYVLMDAGNKPVRRFIASGTQSFNILSFYSEGEEVYRETDSKGTGKVDHYRWLGAGGGKIGRDVDGNGTIDVWENISAEELSKELFDALAAKDVNRFKALLPSEPELKSIGLPAAEIAKVQSRSAAAITKFTALATSLNLSKGAKWTHVELWLPRTTPADAFGGTQDLVKHPNGGVLFDKGDNKSLEFISTGEIIKVGNAWRLVDGPAAGAPQAANNVAGGGNTEISPEVKPLVEQLVALKAPDQPGAPAIKYQLERAGILEKIVAALNGKADQETWLRQLIDAYSAAADFGDKTATDKLAAWKAQIDKFAAKSALAGYVGFRAMGVEYAAKLKDSDTPVKVANVQKWWREELEKFVAAYPTSEETPEALYRLAMATEFNGKDGEIAAKNHYAALAKNFPQHPLAAQGAGAANRLDSEGKPFMLAGNELATGKPFNPAVLTGKVTLVYFWGSFAAQNPNFKQEVAYLADIAKKNAGKVEIVTITLDQSAQSAVGVVNALQMPGTHLISPNGAMATAYGIMGQHLFVVGKDGKVANKNATIPAVGDEVEKLVK